MVRSIIKTFNLIMMTVNKLKPSSQFYPRKFHWKINGKIINCIDNDHWYYLSDSWVEEPPIPDSVLDDTLFCIDSFSFLIFLLTTIDFSLSLSLYALILSSFSWSKSSFEISSSPWL